ncbi:methyltransferase [Xenorhabdus budapestensis]|nr:methyltransferase [Xenorhabdus budapestensis]
MTDILKNIHQVMRDDSVLYIIDTIKEENNVEDISFHLFMVILFRGKIRYQSEYEELANNAGFYINNIYKITSSEHIIEMKKKTCITQHVMMNGDETPKYSCNHCELLF